LLSAATRSSCSKPRTERTWLCKALIKLFPETYAFSTVPSLRRSLHALMHVLWYIFSKYYYYLRICFIALFCFVSFCVGFWFPSAYGEIHVFLCLAFSLLLHSRISRTVICSAIRFERRASRGPGMWEKLCIVNKNVVVLTTAEHPSGRRWAASIRFFFSFQWARDLVPCCREFLSVSLVLEDFWHLLENLFFGHKKEQNLLRDTSYYYCRFHC
jgi:hypothetical protein